MRKRCRQTRPSCLIRLPKKIWERGAALPWRLHLFEAEALSRDENLESRFAAAQFSMLRSSPSPSISGPSAWQASHRKKPAEGLTAPRLLLAQLSAAEMKSRIESDFPPVAYRSGSSRSIAHTSVREEFRQKCPEGLCGTLSAGYNVGRNSVSWV